MAIKSILVHLCGTDAGKSVVATARTLAAAHDAKLVGIFAGVPYDMPTYVMAQLPPEVIASHQKHVEENAHETSKAFEAACKADGLLHEVREGDWREPVEDVISMHARYSDLVVIAQPDPESGSRQREIADHVVLRAATPVVVVPRKAAVDTIGTRVIVGWDGSAPAARAVQDSLPLLEKAGFVKVLCIDPKPGIAGLGDLPGADLCQYLASHGVNAEAAHTPSGGVAVGDILLNNAADMGADLIVSGSYGHSRIGELIMGGVTDTLMNSMTVPTLMSH